MKLSLASGAIDAGPRDMGDATSHVIVFPIVPGIFLTFGMRSKVEYRLQGGAAFAPRRGDLQPQPVHTDHPFSGKWLALGQLPRHLAPATSAVVAYLLHRPTVSVQREPNPEAFIRHPDLNHERRRASLSCSSKAVTGGGDGDILMKHMHELSADLAQLNVRPVLESKGDLCRDILGGLPEWFSEAEGVEACAAIVEDLPMLAVAMDGTVAGIIALKAHVPDAMEIFVLATRRGHHRRGIGRRLVAAAGHFAVEAGCRLLTVKTLAPRGRPEPQFEATRAFYSRSGFFRAEVFPTLWHVDHPCLLLVKPL